jgi:hypothetical protein
LLIGAIFLPCGLFQQFDDEKHEKWRGYAQLMLLKQQLTRWWYPVASRVVKPWTSSSGDARGILPPHCIKTASKVCILFPCCCFACDRGSHWSNTEQLVAVGVI